VEYGGPGDLPTAPENVSFQVNISEPTPLTVPIASCLDLINVYNNGSDNRYDLLQLTSDVDCTGESLQPMFTEVDMDFGTIGFRGEFDGQGHTLSNVSVIDGSNSNHGLFAYINDAEFHDVTFTGDVQGSDCVGGIVGVSYGGDFVNVTSSINVEGIESVGGFVGCLETDGSAESNFNTVTSSGVIESDDSYVGGFIGEIDMEGSSTLDITGATFSGNMDNADSYVGGVFGDGDFENNTQTIISDIQVDTSDTQTVNIVGGVGGDVDLEDNAMLTVEDVTLNGELTGDEYVGGVFGDASVDDPSASLEINNVTIETDISVDSYYGGGLIGYGTGVEINNSSYEGNLFVAYGYAGGLVGYGEEITVTESYASGSVEINNDYYAGGLFGYIYESDVFSSYSESDVTSTSSQYIGGLTGYAEYSTIENSYARGDATGDTFVAGFVGYCYESELQSTYATGLVTGNADNGGLIGYGDGCDVADSFWDYQTTGQLTSGGDETPKSTIEMKNVATFTDTDTVGLDVEWNFSGTWSIEASANDGYPCLIWSAGGCPQSFDSDDIPTYIEQDAPNNGDANNDGFQDAEQPYVSSFVNPVTTQYTVVQTDSACTLEELAAESESAKAVQDSGYAYTSGLVNFSADCGAPGYTTTVRVIVYGASTDGLVLRKHNPLTNAYFTIVGATITRVTIGGQNAMQVTYQITDGGSLDIDGLANGRIIDPVGLATLVAGVPNTGFSRQVR
jgi:hypothetical protein